VRTSVVFAVAHLAGTLVGLPSGAMLPWWVSGAPAWVIGFSAWALQPLQPNDGERRLAFTCGMPRLIGTRLRDLDVMYRSLNRHLYLGLFWGCLAGTLAASWSDLVSLVLWPYDDRGFGPVVAVVMSLGWLVGSATEDEATAPTSPMLTGLGLYLVIAGLCSLPVLWEAL
jgi:hypothetical protein